MVQNVAKILSIKSYELFFLTSDFNKTMLRSNKSSASIEVKHIKTEPAHTKLHTHIQ